MNKSYKFSFISAVVLFSMFVSVSVFAAVTNVPTPDQIQKGNIVANVSIKNAKIVSQDGHTFGLSFDLVNKKGIQTGVKYSVKLLAGAKYDQTIDTKVYDESLVLQENSTTSKEITYTAPESIKGEYTLLVSSDNSSGFPYGIAFFDKVTLTKASQGIEIIANSCYLTKSLDADKKATRYGIVDGISLEAEDTLYMTCNVTNHSNETLSAVPTYETRSRSEYGDIAETQGGDLTPIQMKAQEKSTFTVALPKATMAQFYVLRVGLASADKSSNTIQTHYFVKGIGATIQNLSLDKNAYKKGETAQLALMYNQTPGAIVSLSARMTSGDTDRACADLIENMPLKVVSGQPITDIPASVKAACRNPHVSITLKDDKGTILDQKDFAFESSGPMEQPVSAKTGVIIAALLLAIIAMAVYMNKRKNS